MSTILPAQERAHLSTTTHHRRTPAQRQFQSASIRAELIETLRLRGDWHEPLYAADYDPYFHAKELQVSLWYQWVGEPWVRALGITSWSKNDGPRIYIQPGLTSTQARATLAHELVHAVVGRDPRCGDPLKRQRLTTRAYEDAVDEVAALRLIPFDLLLLSAEHSHRLRELAVACQVDEAMVRARLRALDNEQRAVIAAAMARARARVTRARRAALGCEDHRPGWTCLTHPDGHRIHLRPRKPTTPTATKTERHES